MKAVSNYKDMIEELGKMIGIFANFQNYPFMQLAKEQGWTLDHISEIQGKVQASTMIPEQIKEELIGDGDEAKFVGRLKTAFFELGADPNFAPSYFPKFDEALFELPSKEHPDRNKELYDALASIYGNDTSMLMVRLESICQTANFIVQRVSDMLDDVCTFVGYTPEPQHERENNQQEQPEPQQEQKAAAQDYNIEPQQGEQTTVVLPDVLNTQKTRAVFDEAISRGWMKENSKGGYEWLGLKDWKRGKQQQFVYMVGQMYGYKKSDSGNDGNSIPCKPLEKLFGISGIYSLLIKCWEASKPQPWRQAIDDMITAALQKIIVSTSN